MIITQSLRPAGLLLLLLSIYPLPAGACENARASLNLELAETLNGERMSVSFSPQFADCRYVLIDRAVAAVESDARPVSVLKLTVTEEATGVLVRPTTVIRGDMKGVSAGELILTSCRNRFGWVIDPQGFPWLFDLVAGRQYRIRACLVSKLKTFYEKSPKEFERLTREFGFSHEAIAKSIMDFEVCSNEFVFRAAERK